MGYAYSDHMHVGYSSKEEWNRTQGMPPLSLDKATFEKMAQLPYIDDLYIRVEWRDVMSQPGKITLPAVWQWVLEAAEKYNKRWSFRIMNCSPHSLHDNSLPAFLQGKFKMTPYWYHENVPGPRPKFFPEYNSEYLKRWNETIQLLGQQFDNHERLDYVDVSGYGFWGEMHHWARYSPEGNVTNFQPGSPEDIDAAISSIIDNHLEACPRTPAALCLAASAYPSAQEAYVKGKVWPRRDSFQNGFSSRELALAQGLAPGSAMVWEVLLPGIHCLPDGQRPKDGRILPLPQRYFDIGAHFIALGFNPWDALWANENCLSTCQNISRNIGYRLRPSMVWYRKRPEQNPEIVIGLCNDGCVTPPGQVKITIDYGENLLRHLFIPVGQPASSRMKEVASDIPPKSYQKGGSQRIRLTASITIKGKSWPVQWAVRNESNAPNFSLDIPLVLPLQEGGSA